MKGCEQLTFYKMTVAPQGDFKNFLKVPHPTQCQRLLGFGLKSSKTYGSADITDDAVVLLLLSLVVLKGDVDFVPTLLFQLLQGALHLQLRYCGRAWNVQCKLGKQT